MVYGMFSDLKHPPIIFITLKLSTTALVSSMFMKSSDFGRSRSSPSTLNP